MNEPLGVVGLGAVGGAVASAAAAAGIATVAWTRSYERRELWARRTDGVDIVAGPEEVARAAGLLVLSVEDGALGEVAERCAAVGPAVGRVALHCAGGLDTAVLAPLAERGWATGILHPLRPVLDGDQLALEGTAVGLFGHASARAAARVLVERVGGQPLELEGGAAAQSHYHAAAALLANGAVALFDLAQAEFEAAGASADEARAAARSLFESSATNLGRHRPPEALTGPLSRGDVGRVAEHLEALSPAARTVYAALSRRMLAIVQDDLEPARVAALQQLLERE